MVQCTGNSFRNNKTSFYTDENSATIQEYENANNRTGVTLKVYYDNVPDQKYYGTSRPPPISYSEQIEKWKSGVSLNRVYSNACTPTGWYWVEYKCIFDEGTSTVTKSICNPILSPLNIIGNTSIGSIITISATYNFSILPSPLMVLAIGTKTPIKTDAYIELWDQNKENLIDPTKITFPLGEYETKVLFTAVPPIAFLQGYFNINPINSPMTVSYVKILLPPTLGST